MRNLPKHISLLLILLLSSHGVCLAHPPNREEAREEIEEAEVNDEMVELTIYPSRYSDLLGVAESASQGHIGEEVFGTRPLLRSGELIETVPGLIATQHAGGGKANQYFFRGFNLDHGTDFRTEVDGMPVNLVTHGHGQGYTDLNFLIPELVDYNEYEKGVYSVDKGDFATAGSTEFMLRHRVSSPIAKLTLGEDAYARLYSAASTGLGKGDVLAAVELQHYDGPWRDEEDSRKLNAVLRYTEEDARDTYNVMLMAHRGIWNSSDQIPQRAVEGGVLPRLGTVDPTTGGDTNRFSLSTNWNRLGRSGNYEATAYAIYYDLDLFSNFTYFLEDSSEGDQFKQEDERVYFGGEVEAAHDYEIVGLQSEVSYGLQLRHDHISNVALRHANQRRILSTVREDEVEETQLGLFLKNDAKFSEWLRGYFGVRGDFLFVDVDSDRQDNSGSENDFQLSPKAGLVFGPWASTELYLNGGFGFHSNDARGATTRIDPNTLEAVEPVDLLTEARGAEFGIRSAFVPGLVSTVSVWYLELDNELVFVGDAGTTEVLGASERYGVEISNFYRPLEWFSVYADYSYTHPRFNEDQGGGDLIPNSIEHVFVTGLSFESQSGLLASGKWRHLGTRPLIEDGSVKAPVTSLVDLRIGFQKQNLGIHLDIFNVFDEDDFDIAYFYTSRLPEEDAGGVEDLHYHPVEPRQLRVTLSYTF